LASSPLLTFYRAQTDNDFPQNYGKAWSASFLHESVNHVRSVTWSASAEGVKVVVQARVAPPVLEWSVETTFTYTFTNKHVSIHVAGTPKGVNTPRTWARLGLTFALNNIASATWFGRGPGESYRDKKLAQKFGTYTLPIDALWTAYEFPQESGNRTDVRWVEFAGRDEKPALKASFANHEGASFAATHYAVGDVDAAKHPYELEKLKKEETIVRLDWAHHGLGSGSCGPPTLPQYELNSEAFEYEVLLQ
jgi:beta-galactosidase